nr:hypothetical protein [Alphaproteobacteria bacterium]
MAESAEATGDVAHVTKSALQDEVQSLQARLNELTEECADLRRANRALRDSEGRLSALVEHMPAVAFVRDIEGRFALVNRGY